MDEAPILTTTLHGTGETVVIRGENMGELAITRALNPETGRWEFVVYAADATDAPSVKA